MSKSKHLTSIDYINFLPTSIKYMLSVCEKHQTACQSSESTVCSPSSPSYENLFFLPDRLAMFTMSLPLFLLTLHPYREPSSMYLFALWTCACLHGCALAQAGTWLLWGARDEIAWTSVKLQCLCPQFPHSPQHTRFSCSWYQREEKNPPAVLSKGCAAQMPMGKCKTVWSV